MSTDHFRASIRMRMAPRSRAGASSDLCARPSATERRTCLHPFQDVARGRGDRRRLRRARRRRGRRCVPLLGILVRALRGDGSAARDVRRAQRGSDPARRGRVRGRARRPLRRQRRAVLHVPREGRAGGHPGGRGRGGARGKAQRQRSAGAWARARRAARPPRRTCMRGSRRCHVRAGPAVHERDQAGAPVRVLAESRLGARGHGRRLRDV